MALITSAKLKNTLNPRRLATELKLPLLYDILGHTHKQAYFAGKEPDWWKDLTQSDEVPEWYRLLLPKANAERRDTGIDRLGIHCVMLLLIHTFIKLLEEIERLGADTESREAQLRGYLGFLFDAAVTPVRCVKFIELVVKGDVTQIQTCLRRYQSQIKSAGPVSGNSPIQICYRRLLRALEHLGSLVDLREPPPSLRYRGDTAALRQVGSRGRRVRPTGSNTSGGGT